MYNVHIFYNLSCYISYKNMLINIYLLTALNLGFNIKYTFSMITIMYDIIFINMST